MGESGDARSIRFYFSFRSPYAWLAAERLEEELGDLGVRVQRLPIFPTPRREPGTRRRDGAERREGARARQDAVVIDHDDRERPRVEWGL